MIKQITQTCIKVQIRIIYSDMDSAFSALTLFRKGIRPVKN